MGKAITIALAGNPNSGKTTVFNNLTGTRQHVGNYPGVTVEKKEGFCRHKDYDIKVVDLPGTYSLTAYSLEELIARNFIVDDRPDVVVQVVDASNLERNLYLTVQLIELGAPLVLAFNMNDVAESRGLVFDLEMLSGYFGAPIVPTVASKKRGMDDLLDAVIAVATGAFRPSPPRIDYGGEIEEEIARIEAAIEREGGLDGKYSARWLALKLLERDSAVEEMVRSERVADQVRRSMEHLSSIFHDPPEVVIADQRYGFISGACREAVKRTAELRHTVSDLIDVVVTNRVFGIPIFLALMFGVFQLTFTVGAPFMGWIESFFGWLAGFLGGVLPEGPLRSLVIDGIIGGVGGVLVFLPNILLLFLAIAVLEDSGYMARAAFIMDNVMHRIGLHGKSFVPMLIGFGCSVPAIMATRTLASRRDRLITMLIVPLMSCGARLTIYMLIAPAFFPHAVGRVVFTIYLIGIGLAIAAAKVLRATLLKGEAEPFVMELPPYRMPTFRGVLIHTWTRGSQYLRKAGTVILAISILLWVLMSYPKPPAEAVSGLDPGEKAAVEMSYSLAGRIGHAMEPVLRPLGFDWRIGTALIGAFGAKEVFVAQMGIVFAVGQADERTGRLRAALQENYTPLIGFCVMLFCLITAPCVATIAVTRSESGSWGWALLQLAGLTVLAWVVTFVVYQVGMLLGIGV